MRPPTVREICDFIEAQPGGRHTTEQVVVHFLGTASRSANPSYSGTVERLQRARRWVSKLKRRSWKMTVVPRQAGQGSPGTRYTTHLYELQEG